VVAFFAPAHREDGFAVANGNVARLTICIPTVNRIAFLGQTIDSVLAQTYSPIEIVVSDNSGDAKYSEAVDRLVGEKSGTSIQLIHQAHNVTGTRHFNALVEAGMGEMWLFLPDDDLLRPDFAETAMRVLKEKPDVGFITTSHGIISGDGEHDDVAATRYEETYGRAPRPRGLVAHDAIFGLALNGFFPLQATVFRRDVIRRFGLDPSVEEGPDYDLFLRIGASSLPVNGFYVPERLVDYRLHGAQSVFDKVRWYAAMVCSLERIRDVRPSDRSQYARKLASAQTGLASARAEEGNIAGAARELLRAVRTEPTRWRTYMAVARILLPAQIAWLRRTLGRPA
jgi:glycosyltransferase involved in cell wall biosynthesis